MKVKGLDQALPGWITARALVAVAYLVATVAADELRPGQRPLQVDQGLLAWDGAWYRDIAESGYDGVARSGLRFFPLVPLLARLVALPLGGRTGLALLLVTNLAALAAGIALYRLVLAEGGDQALAQRSAWLLALIPPAAVLVLGYAESTMLAFSIATFLALRGRHWWAAALLGALTGLSRPAGILLVVPAVIEAFRTGRGGGQLGARLAAATGPLVGGAAYLAWVEVRFGDWQLPLRLQSAADLRGEWVNPVARVAEALGEMFSSERLGEGLHVPWILLFLVLLILVFRRWPVSYGAYSAVLLTAALSAESLGSFERYGLSAFPLVLALAGITGGGPWERLTLIGAGAGLVSFSTLVFLGAFVP